MEKDRFIAALLPFCDTVCEYDRSCGKLRVCKTGLAQGISDKWYSVDELRNIFRDGCAVSAEKDVWTRYLSGENLRVEKANETKTAARSLLLPDNAA